MKTTKSSRRVLQFGYLIGLLTFRPYSSKFSRQDFTQPQLFACLVLKEFMQHDYRKVSALLHDSPDLAQAIELEKRPTLRPCRKPPTGCWRFGRRDGCSIERFTWRSGKAN